MFIHGVISCIKVLIESIMCDITSTTWQHMDSLSSFLYTSYYFSVLYVSRNQTHARIEALWIAHLFFAHLETQFMDWIYEMLSHLRLKWIQLSFMHWKKEYKLLPYFSSCPSLPVSSPWKSNESQSWVKGRCQRDKDDKAICKAPGHKIHPVVLASF